MRAWLRQVVGVQPKALRRSWRMAVLHASAGISLALLAAAISFRLHFNLSTAGSIQLLVVVLSALRWGFRQATIVSIAAMTCLNYLFMEPVFKFSIAEPANWIALVTFEMAALLVSALSSEARLQAAEAETQRLRIAKLFEVSQAILLIDPHGSTRQQLAHLIEELVQVEEVDLWTMHFPDDRSESRSSQSYRSAYQVYRSYQASANSDANVSERTLHIGTNRIGAMVLSGWDVDPLMADALASLAAIAFERARSVERENRAEAGRQTEQLRTAVLDALAHAFKTPLTGILTASSGLLELGDLSDTQTQLVSLIETEAIALNVLTTRLLQTAALESREVRLRRSLVDVFAIVEQVVQKQEGSLVQRLQIHLPQELRTVGADASLLRVALEQLVDNAGKYSSVGSTVNVSIMQTDDETTVVVSNTGSSIRQEDRERIFERFFRGAAAAQGPAGTGLGLSIVRKAAEAHGGRAWVECAGDTTAFSFSIMNANRDSR